MICRKNHNLIERNGIDAYKGILNTNNKLNAIYNIFRWLYLSASQANPTDDTNKIKVAKVFNNIIVFCEAPNIDDNEVGKKIKFR